MKSTSKKKVGPLKRLVRTVLSVVVLTALLLGVTVLTKQLWHTDTTDAVKALSSVLSKANVDVNEEAVGQVAGKFVERISQTNLGSGVTDYRIPSPTESNSISNTYADDTSEIILSVALLSDVHEDIDNLNKSITLIKERNITNLFMLGDLTNFGDTQTLSIIKGTLDESNLNYWGIPGDHDIAESLSASNFSKVFGDHNFFVTLSGVKFLLLDNSANYTKISPEDLIWFKTSLPDADFVLLSQPLYTESLLVILQKAYMGSTVQESPLDLQDDQELVRLQGVEILSFIRESTNVSAIFAGDHHRSSKQDDPIRASLQHYVVGPVSSKDINEFIPQSSWQTPRFSILHVYSDGTFSVEEVLLD